jgi:hypothetical protein
MNHTAATPNPTTLASTQFGEHEVHEIATAVGCILAQVCATNEKAGSIRNQPKSRFVALDRPTVSIQSYIARVAQYSRNNAQAFILALIYIDRLIQRNPTFLITSLNAHRLFLTAIMTAAKFSNDFYFKNSFYAKVGGVSLEEMNSLELEFLFRIHFDLFVPESTFMQYRQNLSVFHAESSPRKTNVPGRLELVAEDSSFCTDNRSEQAPAQEKMPVSMAKAMATPELVPRLKTGNTGKPSGPGPVRMDLCIPFVTATASAAS